MADTLDKTESSDRNPAYGILQIDGKPATSVRFEHRENEGEKTFVLSYHMGQKTVAKLKDLDADQLAEAVGEKNAKIIISTEERGSLKAESLAYELGVSPAGKQRREIMKTNQQNVEMAQQAQSVDEPEENNVVEQWLEKQFEIDTDDVLFRAEEVRKRDRDLLKQADQERVEIDSNEVLIRAEQARRRDRDQLASEQGKRAEEEHEEIDEFAEKTGSPSNRDNQQLAEREKNRRVELVEQVHNQFRVAGAKYHFKDQPEKIAFKDKGERMVSASNDDRVAKAMATMAEAKGWKTIKVSGHPDFKREVWMEASLRGIAVRGYKPTEQEQQMLDERRERAMHNKVERDPANNPARQVNRTQDAQHKPLVEKGARAHPTQDKDTAALPKQSIEMNVKQAALRTYSGRVIEHGEANYDHDPHEKMNYFVKLDTGKGEKTIWGIDLDRAMKTSGAQVGDNVKLEFKGETPVIVEALKRDKDGKVIGKEEITTNRNEWEVLKSDKAKIVQSVGADFINSKVKVGPVREALYASLHARIAEREKMGNVPSVPIYDKNAPSRTPTRERTGPVVEQNAERTR